MKEGKKPSVFRGSFVLERKRNGRKEGRKLKEVEYE
jgi:hypothetical protein